VTVRKKPRSSHLGVQQRDGRDDGQRDGLSADGFARTALQLGFVALVIGSAVLLVALGYPAAAVVEAVVGAGLAAVEMIRRLRGLG